MKSVKIIENKAVTKIQAVIRGKQAKDYVEKSRRRLVRQRNARRVEKRQKMALKVRCVTLLCFLFSPKTPLFLSFLSL